MQKNQEADAFGFIDVIFHDAHMVRQTYARNTAILVTRLRDEAGNGIEITDFAPRFYMHGRMFAPAMLVREQRGLHSVQLDVDARNLFFELHLLRRAVPSRSLAPEGQEERDGEGRHLN